MYNAAPYRYEVYSTPDGEIAIDATEDEISIVVLCHPNGSARCFVSMDDDQRRAWYSSHTKVYGAFLRDALSKLMTLTGGVYHSFRQTYMQMSLFR